MSSVDSNATVRPSPLIDGLRLMPSSVVFVIRRSPADWVKPRRKPVRHSNAVAARIRASIVVRRTGGRLTEIPRDSTDFLNNYNQESVHLQPSWVRIHD